MKRLVSIAVLLTTLFTAAPSGALQTVTIVPPESRVSDGEARHTLARILSYNDATLRESLLEYRALMALTPGDPAVETETAQVLLRLGMGAEAAALLRGLYARNPGDSIAAAALADIECSRGHAVACRDLYLDALRTSGHRPDLELRFADKMNMWGDFVRARSLYRRHLTANPGDRDVALRLAMTLASSERYEEAEGVCRELMPTRKDTAVLTTLASIKLLEKDFPEAERYAREALSVGQDSREASRILWEALLSEGRYHEARSVYEGSTRQPGEAAEAHVNIGRTYLRQKNAAGARRHFQEALAADPANISARFYANWPDTVRYGAFVSSIVDDTALSPAGLSRWAEMYLSHGFFPEAIACLKEALRRDPAFFPASISLAQALGSDRQYEASVTLYRDLAVRFPDSSKILTGLARVLAWSRRYDESMAIYRRIIALDPSNPVPRREMARTAMWAKEPDLAMKIYDDALSTPGEDPARSTKDRAHETPDSRVRERIRRSILLEKEAKKLAYDGRIARSLPVYETLIRENPGNEEALFDEAQATCALGLCGREARTYERLLAIDPLHLLAAEALERLRSRANPSARFDYSYWNEEGRGDLARITRNRFDVTVDVPVWCQYHFFLKGHRWLDTPDFDRATYGADGVSVGFAGVFSPFVKAEGSWTRKRYDSNTLSDRDTGHGTVWFNLDDRMRLGLGYARTDEIYNYFGIVQGTQADRVFVAFHSNVTRKFEASGRAAYTGYNDSNSGSLFSLAAGYALTDHPRTFKVTASGEMRNTRHDNEYVYRNGELVDIIHPYWAPRDYLAGSVILEWRHDLSKTFICGSEQHYYDLKASFGADSENNPYAKIEGEWSWEFLKHWLVGIKGLAHTSPKWNATGAWAWLRYRF